MASPDSNQQQSSWVPYESAKDCSQGFCSIYCTQWCYVIFPPPPPFSFINDNDSSGSTTFSPLVIAIIGIFASAFLLVSYYTIISKYCGGFRPWSCRRQASPDDSVINDDDDGSGDRSHPHEMWHVSPSSNGLDEALISKIWVYKYRRGEGVVDGTDCPVCLSEFREQESLKLLPKCSHAFHLHCIDTWLRSHSNCPLCRATIVSVNPGPPQLPPPHPLSPLRPSSEGNDSEREQSEGMIVAIEDLEDGTCSESDDDDSKETSGDNHDIIEVQDDEEGIQDFSHRGRVSIADVLQLSMEDEFMVAKDDGVLIDDGRSSRSQGENSNKSSSRSRSLHCVTSPVQMKRSVSDGWLGFARQSKGRSSVLPV